MLKLAGPIMMAQFLVFSMTFVDNVMVGRLGPVELGGLALASAFYTFVTIIVLLDGGDFNVFNGGHSG